MPSRQASNKIPRHAELTVVLIRPYPTLKGIQAVLSELAVRNPRAKEAQPAQFANVNFLKELDDSGYIDRLYKTAER